MSRAKRVLCSTGDRRVVDRRGLCRACYDAAERVVLAAGAGAKVQFRTSAELRSQVMAAATAQGLTEREAWEAAGRAWVALSGPDRAGE